MIKIDSDNSKKRQFFRCRSQLFTNGIDSFDLFTGIANKKNQAVFCELQTQRFFD